MKVLNSQKVFYLYAEVLLHFNNSLCFPTASILPLFKTTIWSAFKIVEIL